MKKAWLYILGVGLVAAAAAGIIIAKNNSNDHSDKASNSAKTSPNNQTAKQACAIFTLTDAKQLLGDNAKGGENPIHEASHDLNVSSCTYTQDQGANTPVSSRNSASLLMRAPKTSAGTISNQNQFGPLRPAESQTLSGYSDKVYWDPQFGQLNILKNNTWYILSNGPATPTDRKLSQAQQLADILISKL